MSRIPVIYVFGPFTGKSPEEVALNIESARQCGKLLVRKGWMPIIPHANTAGFDVILPDVNYQFWLDGTMELLRRADAAFGCPGWEHSGGSIAEERKARRLGLPVYFETRAVPDAASVKGATSMTSAFQRRVTNWLRTTFEGWPWSFTSERSKRFLEEALELVQAAGLERDVAHRLVDYVYDRKVGHVGQEIGGVMVTLVALADVLGVDAGRMGLEELDRIERPEVRERVRERQTEKDRAGLGSGGADMNSDREFVWTQECNQCGWKAGDSWERDSCPSGPYGLCDGKMVRLAVRDV